MTSNLPNKKLILNAIETSTAFALWSFPNKQKVEHIFCPENKLLKTFSTKNINQYNGFVFAPFQVSKDYPIYIIPFNQSAQKTDTDINKLPAIKKFKAHTSDKEKYIKQIEKFTETIKQSDIKKAVLSGCKEISKYNFRQVYDFFNELLKTYPNAFVYQVFIPNVGYWAGASPELLLELNQSKAKTVSLAGTQKYENGKDVVWSNKEKKEQELVTKHIRSVLNDFNISDFNETAPQTTKAGKMVHIKTKIEFESKKIENKLGCFIDKLHPTPAVCGLPVDKSLQLILDTESHKREYYTGFLGVLNPKQTELYVNLRCLQAFSNSIVLYAGGGITKDSIPEQEWEEVVLKFKTLENIPNNLM